MEEERTFNVRAKVFSRKCKHNFEKTCLKSVDLMNFRVEYVRPRSEADDEVQQILKKQGEGFQKVHG